MIPVVLCVDDDKIALMISKINMQKTNFCNTIITVENGKEALDYIASQVTLPNANNKIPNLILLDLNMPIIDGWEFLEIFSQKYKYLQNEVKIILLSSSINPDDKNRADENPFVLALIDKALGIDNLKSLKNIAALSRYFADEKN